MLRQSIQLALLAATLSATCAAEEPRIADVLVEPTEMTLTDADQSVQFLVTLKMSDGTLRDATRQAEYAVQGDATGGDGRSAVGWTPKGDGTVTVICDRDRSHLPREKERDCEGHGTRASPSSVDLHFINDIEPILTKTGCNSGGCHGKASRPEWFPALALRVRAEVRLRRAGQRSARTPRLPRLARGVAPAEKGHRRDGARRRRALR